MPIDARANRDSALKFVVIRPATYAVVLAAVFLAAFVFKLRTEGIFACQADAYSSSIYLGYCNSVAYGDYDHGAFWFGLEPEAVKGATEADALFLGSSRMQFGLSSPQTREWFAERSLRYYLLGFSHTENIVFAAPLIAKIRPLAKVYIINVDGFFDDRESPPVARIFHADAIESEYVRKRIWQYPHQFVCGFASLLCGDEIAFYRDRERGDWLLSASDDLKGSDVADGPPGTGEFAEASSRAREFVGTLPVDRRCVLLTIVPSRETPRTQAQAIADSLGTALIAPQLAGLNTFDGSHLDPPSAERWSAAFFQEAGPQISRCLDVAVSN